MPEDTYDSILKRHGVSLGQEPTTQTASAPAVTEAAPAEAPAPTSQPQGAGGSGYEDILRRHGVSLAPAQPAPQPVQATQPDPTGFPDKYNTALPPDQEARFQEWAKDRKNGAGGLVINDLPDYDVRGRYQQLEAMTPEERAAAEAPGAHGPDTFKKPSHITFSNESKYHGVDGNEGGVWGKDEEGKDTFTPGPTNLQTHGQDGLNQYFDKNEPGLRLLMPGATPEAAAAVVAKNATPPQDEIVPGGFGGQVKPELPEALAPTAAQPGQPGQPPKSVWDSIFYVTQEGGTGQLNRAMAGLANPVLEMAHGLARGAEKTINFTIPLWKLNDNAPDWTWQNSPTGALTAATEWLKKSGAPELPRADEPMTRWTTGLLGGLAAFMVGPKVMGLPHVPAAEIFGKGLAAADRLSAAGTALATNLLNFGMVDVSQAISKGGGLPEARKALETSMQSAALFTLAGALPFSELIKNQWLVKALESTATGGAFAGSAMIQGEKDSWALAESFLTGFGLHALTSGGPMALQKYGDWQHGKKVEAFKDELNAYFDEWRKASDVRNPENLDQAKLIIERVADHYQSVYDKTPEVAAPYTPDQKLEMMFGSRANTLKLPEAEAVRQLTAEVGGHERAQRFYDLFKSWDADTAMQEFPELSTQATEQQKAAEVKPTTPARAAGPMIPGAYSAAERRVAPEAKPESVFKPDENLPGELGKPAMAEEVPRDYRSLVNKVNDGDPATASKLNDIMANNQETINTLLGTPRDQRGDLLNLSDRVEILWDRIDKTGDPAAAKELTELLRTNEERMRALPRLSAPTSTTNVARPAGPVIPSSAAAESLGVVPKEVVPAEKQAMPGAIVPTREGQGEQTPLFPKEAEASPEKSNAGGKRLIDMTDEELAQAVNNADGELEGFSVEEAAPIFYSKMARELESKLPGESTPDELRKLIRGWAGLTQVGVSKKWEAFDPKDDKTVKRFKKEEDAADFANENGLSYAEREMPVYSEASYKAEELKWSELGDWLAEQKGKVTKQQVLDYLDKNQVEVKEIYKGERVPVTAQQEAAIEAAKQKAEQAMNAWEGYEYDAQMVLKNGGLHSASDRQHVIDTIEKGPLNGRDGRHAAALKEAERVAPDFDWQELYIRFKESSKAAREAAKLMETDTPSPTKYSDYKLLGGEDYRELLLTLPNMKSPAYYQWQDYIKQMADKYGADWTTMRLNPDERTKLESLHRMAGSGSGAIYKSSHWDEPNVLAHIRFVTRIDAQGRKTLFIEEVQSDWHQEAKKKGYRVSTEQFNALQEQLVGLKRLLDQQNKDREQALKDRAAVGRAAYLANRGITDVKHDWAKKTHIDINVPPPDTPSGYTVGKKPVEADVLGSFAIHKAYGKAGFEITHVPSGYLVPRPPGFDRTLTKTKAKEIAEYLNAHALQDWNVDTKTVSANSAAYKEDIKQAVMGSPPEAKFYEMGPEHSAEASRLAQLIGDLHNEREKTRQAIHDKQAEVSEASKGVADAPYAKTWHELALKRMLRYAAENGYDQIGWISGEKTKERYDLSKQIDELTYWTKTNELVGHKDGQQVVKKVVEPDKLGDYVGKEIADRLLSEDGLPKVEVNPVKSPMGNRWRIVVNGKVEHSYDSKEVAEATANQYRVGENQRKLTGLQLRVGGQWAINLYNKTVPQFLSQYGKKWGAQVGEGEFDTARKAVYQGPEYTVEQLEEMLPKATERWTTEINKEESDYLGEEIRDVLDANGNVRATLRAEEVADYMRGEQARLASEQAQVAARVAGQGAGPSAPEMTPALLRMISDMKEGMSFEEAVSNESTQVAVALGGDFVRPKEKYQTIPVTPEMKESVLKKGQPAYAVEGEAAAPVGLFPSEFKLTKEHLQEKVFKDCKVFDLGSGRYAVETPSGSTFAWRETGYIEIDPAVYQQGYADALTPGKRALGKYTILGKDAFVALATGYKVGTIYHEAYHIAETLFLTKREIEAIRKKYPATADMSAEEAAAHAYEAWATDRGAAPNTIWQKIKDGFSRMLHSIRPTAGSSFKELQSGRVWERQAREAKVIRETSGGTLKLAGEGVGFGVTTFKEDLLKNQELINAIAETSGFPAAEAEGKAMQFLKDGYNVYRQILSEPDLQFDWDKGSPFWAVKKNADFYRWSEDFTTLCKNRAFMTATVDAIQKKIKSFLSKEDLLQVWTMLKAEGYPVECGPCYVSTARGRMGVLGDKFLTEWKKLEPGEHLHNHPFWSTKRNVSGYEKIRSAYEGMDVKPDLPAEYFLTEEGQAKLKKEDPVLYKQLWKQSEARGGYKAVEWINQHGKPDIPLEYFLTSQGNEKLAREYPEIYSAFSEKVFGSAKAKPIEGSVEYNYEWLNDMVPDGSMKMSTFIAKVNRRGGVRSQSWSDFQMQHLLDKMQAIYDCSIRGAKRHSYTKVVEMVEAFGLTGEKINMSLIPGAGNGLTADRKDFTFADGVTTFPWIDAQRLRQKFKENAGTVMLGVSDEHIRFAMAHPEIDYIIPYHKSGRSQVMLAAYGMEGWTDYTYEQGWKDVTNPEKPKKMSISVAADDKRIPCWDDYAYDGDKPRTPQEAVDKFFDLCKKENLEPPFKRFAGEEGNYDPNYLKLITDTKWMHDGEMLPKQRVVEPVFDQETINGLIKKFVENPSRLVEDPPQGIVDKFLQGRKFGELEKKAGLPDELAPTGLSVEDRNRRKEEKAAYPIGEVKDLKGGAQSVELTRLPEEIAPRETPASPEKSFMEKYLPGYNFAEDVRQGALLRVGPTAKGPEWFQAGVVLGSHLGAMHRAVEATYAKFKADSKNFDKLGIFRKDVPLQDNLGMQLMSYISDPKGKTLPPELEPFRPVVDRIRGAFYDRVQRLEDVGAPLERLREYYFPGMWKKESIRAFNLAMEEAINAGRGGEAREGGVGGQIMDVNDWSPADRSWVAARTKELLAAGEGSDKSHLAFLTRRPFKGTESFRKAKVFDDVMTGVEFGLEPISTNPIDLVKLKLSELDRSIMANGAIQEWKGKAEVKQGSDGEWKVYDQQGKEIGSFAEEAEANTSAKQYSRENADIMFLHTSKSVPEGWKAIEDKYGTVYGKYDSATGTRPIIGRYIAKIPVWDVLNNYLSSSIYNSPAWGKAFKNYMFVGNLLNEVQLGVFSAFHAGFTSVETQITAGASIFKDVYGAMIAGNRTWRDVAKGIKKYPTAFITTAMEGGKVLSEFNSPSGIDTPTDIATKFLNAHGENGIALVAKAAELAGGGFAMDRGLRTYQAEAMVRDWNSGKKIKALARSPMALIEVSMKPVLEWLVPRQKAGVFGEMVGRIVEMNPDKTMLELRPEFREAWNRVDARLGQVRYDRLFLDNAYKNAIQAIIRAPGWTGGTLTEVGGAPVDAAKFLKEWISTGKAPKDIPNRVAYTMSLFATVCLANGLMTYLFTGETPKGVDFFAFRSGGKDVHGNDNRWLLPTYMKDLFAYFRDPQHTIVAKTHPLLSVIGDIMKNKTYYGEQITNEDRNWYQRLADRGYHGLATFTPFWMSGANKAVERAGGWEKPTGDILERIAPPLVGVMPAPRPYTATDAQKVIDKYNELTRPAITTKETVEAKDIKRRLMEMARNQDEAGFQELATEAIGSGSVTLKSVKDLMKDSQNPPGLSRFTKLPLEWALKAFDAANEAEQTAWKPYLLKKIQGGKPEVIYKHQDRVVGALEKLSLSKAAEAVKKLSISEKYSQLDTTGLGVEKEAPQMAAMGAVDDAIAEALEKMTGEKTEKKKGLLPRSPLSHKKKKNPYEALGL